MQVTENPTPTKPGDMQSSSSDDDSYVSSNIKKSYGFIQLPRELFGDRCFTESRKFSKFEAIVDIHHLAQFTHNPTTRIMSGKAVTWGYGQLPASIRYLEKRWNWSKDKVASFLRDIQKRGIIKISQNSGQTILEVINYGKAKKSVQPTGQKNGRPEQPLVSDTADLPDTVSDTNPNSDQDTDRTPTGTTINKEKKVKKALIINYAHSDDEFIKAFTAWMQFKREKGKPLVQTTIDKQNEFLKQYSLQEAIAIINQSIETIGKDFLN